MIIYASYRTDIPSFYGEWFYNRAKEGYLLVRNPSGIENNEYFIIPYDCDIGYNKYEKGGGKENGNIRIFYKKR